MIKQFGVLFAVVLGCISTTAFSQEITEEQNDSVVESTQLQNDLSENEAFDVNGHSQWRFVGCVHDDNHHDECEHLAEDHGYHHSYAQHDHHRCHDHDHTYACFGKN